MSDQHRPDVEGRAGPPARTDADMKWVTPAADSNAVVIRERQLVDVDYVWNTRGAEGIYPTQ